MSPMELLGPLELALGFELVSAGKDQVDMRWQLSLDSMDDGKGRAHHGVYACAIESSASIGAFLRAPDRGPWVGVSNRTDVLQDDGAGLMTATAAAVHEDGGRQLWEVTVRDASGRHVARGLVNLQGLGQPPQR